VPAPPRDAADRWGSVSRDSGVKILYLFLLFSISEVGFRTRRGIFTEHGKIDESTPKKGGKRGGKGGKEGGRRALRQHLFCSHHITSSPPADSSAIRLHTSKYVWKRRKAQAAHARCATHRTHWPGGQEQAAATKGVPQQGHRCRRRCRNCRCKSLEQNERAHSRRSCCRDAAAAACAGGRGRRPDMESHLAGRRSWRSRHWPPPRKCATQ
jgi:hypothetical protein